MVGAPVQLGGAWPERHSERFGRSVLNGDQAMPHRLTNSCGCFHVVAKIAGVSRAPHLIASARWRQAATFRCADDLKVCPSPGIIRLIRARKKPAGAFISNGAGVTIDRHEKRPYGPCCEDGDKQRVVHCPSQHAGAGGDDAEQHQLARLPVHLATFGALPLYASRRSLARRFASAGGVAWRSASLCPWTNDCIVGCGRPQRRMTVLCRQPFGG